MADNTNPMVSHYPSNYQADALQRVTRTLEDIDFPISGDTRQRMAVRLQQHSQPYWSVPEHLTTVARGVGPWKH